MIGSEYFSRVFVDTQNPDVLYVSQTSMYRSTDGGKTFEAFAGAPSGDDFHVAWIDPRDPARMIFGVDQGAIVSVDAGKTWSSWYNQPTGQFYHVSTDNVFPYRVYAAQQDSGTAARSQSQRLWRDSFAGLVFHRRLRVRLSSLPTRRIPTWFTAEAGTARWFVTTNRPGKSRWYSSAARNIAPRKCRRWSSRPRMLSTLYLGMQFVLKTRMAGRSWQEISPDLDRLRREGGTGEARSGQAASAGHHRTVTVNRSGRRDLGWHKQPAGSTHSRRRSELAKTSRRPD